MKRIVTILSRGIKSKKPDPPSPAARDQQFLQSNGASNNKLLKLKEQSMKILSNPNKVTEKEKNAQINELLRNHDLLTSNFTIDQINNLYSERISKETQLRIILQREEMRNRWREPWWNRLVWYGLIVVNGIAGYYLAKP